jgi:hypothetical protein
MIVNGIFLKSNNINKIKESYGDAWFKTKAHEGTITQPKELHFITFDMKINWKFF